MDSDKPRTVSLIVNTKSRRGEMFFDVAVGRLRAMAGVKLSQTVAVSDPTTIGVVAAKLLADRPDILVVGSGDGTVSQIVDLVVSTDTALAIIPLGTTNNYARTLGLPLKPLEALEVVGTGSAEPVDLARTGHDYFANVASIGLSTSIARAVSPRAKRYVGRLAYGLAAIQELVTHRSFAVTVEADDGTYSFSTHQIIIANGRYHGGSLISSSAGIQTGHLIVFRLDSGNRITLIRNFIRFNARGLESMKHLTAITARKVTVTTAPRRQIEIDGELAARTPATFECIPAAIRVIMPPSNVKA